MRYTIVFLSIFLLILSINVFAQESDSDTPVSQSLDDVLIEELLVADPMATLTEEEKAAFSICSLEASYGLVNIDMTSEITEILSGTSLKLTGEIENLSDSDLVKGTLYARVLKSEYEEYSTNIVDQFVVQEDIAIPTKKSIPVSFDWKTPSVLESGKYRIVFYFYTDNKIDVSGILNSPDSYEKYLDFSVTNEDELTPVRFEPAVLGVNLQAYSFGANPTNISESGEILITAPVFNASDENQNVQVEWKVFKNDKRDPNNLVKVINSDASIAANSSYEFALELKETDFAIYHIVGELKDRDSKSFVEILLAREGVPAIKIHSSAIDAYPLVSGENNTMSVCISNVGSNPVTRDARILLELKNLKGRVIEKYEYQGPITSQVISLSKDFISKSNLDSFSIHAKVFQGENLLNEFERVYDCNVLSTETCANDTVVSKILYVFGGILLILLIVLISNRIKKNKNIILPLLILALLISFPNVGEAKSTSATARVSSMTTGGYPSYTLGNVTMTTTYSADIKNASTNASIPDGAFVPEGTQIKLTFSSSNGIAWQATSPKWMYGSGSEWGSGGPSSACSGAYTDRSDLGGLTSNAIGIAVNTNRTIYTYLKAVVSTPSRSITKSGNLTCGGLSGNTMTCTVTGPGPISVNFNFAGTSGRIYRSTNDVHTQSGYYIMGTQTDSTCRGPYQLNPSASLPGATITYNFTGGAPTPPNRAPEPPVITGPTAGNPTTNYTFGFRATDPDEGDKIRYGIDWNNDNTVDEWVPASGYINSGVLRNAGRSWPTVGTKTFKARTQDQAGLNSGWTSYSITLSNPSTNGLCGTTNNSCLAGSSVDVADSATSYLWSCNGTNGGTNASCSITKPPVAVNGVCGATNNSCTAGTLFDIADSATNYLWRCRGDNGGTVASCSLPITTIGNDSFAVSCSAPSILPGSQATFTATPVGEIGSVSYQWKEEDGTNISGATNQTFRRTYNNIGSYLLNISATNQGVTKTNFCRVTVGCSNVHYEGKEFTSCTAGTQEVYTCTSSGWTTTSRPCTSGDDPTGTFNFNPGIVTSVNGRCSIEIEAENVSSCRLIKGGATYVTTPSLNDYLSGTSIAINGQIQVPIGRYTLECTGIGATPVTETFATKSCILNPNIRED